MIATEYSEEPRKVHLADYRLVEQPHGYGSHVIPVEMDLFSEEQLETVIVYMSHKQIDDLYRDMRHKRNYIKPYSNKAKERKV